MAFVERLADTDSPWVTLLDLRLRDCRWPKGDPGDLETFRYCGLDALPNRSYCAGHCALAYMPLSAIRGQKIVFRHWHR
jgi:hypothetical protein